MKKLFSKDQKGFTIIEVMIVLAIAGLIIAVVLVAVPQLQRNQRNNARKGILNRVKTEVDNYSGNNNGGYPSDPVAGTAAGEFGAFTAAVATTAIPTGNTFVGRYLTGIDSNDPNTGRPGSFAGANGTDARPTYDSTTGYSILYGRSMKCSTDGQMTALATASVRKYAVSIGLEGGSAYCLDNQ